MQIDSGTLCSLHQAASSPFLLPPNSAENFGSVQSVACPHTAMPTSAAKTAIVGTLARRRLRGVESGRCAGCWVIDACDMAKLQMRADRARAIRLTKR